MVKRLSKGLKQERLDCDRLVLAAARRAERAQKTGLQLLGPGV
jgi:hypothetical protein